MFVKFPTWLSCDIRGCNGLRLAPTRRLPRPASLFDQQPPAIPAAGLHIGRHFTPRGSLPRCVAMRPPS